MARRSKMVMSAVFGEDVHQALYRWDVWAAAYLIGGGCSDDSFMDFRAGLIAQGRDWYQKAAASPASGLAAPSVWRGDARRLSAVRLAVRWSSPGAHRDRGLCPSTTWLSAGAAAGAWCSGGASTVRAACSTYVARAVVVARSDGAGEPHKDGGPWQGWYSYVDGVRGGPW